MTEPTDKVHPVVGQLATSGITVREYFAVKALQGLCADSQRNGSPSAYARDAVLFADALITELKRVSQ